MQTLFKEYCIFNLIFKFNAYVKNVKALIKSSRRVLLGF